MKNPFLMFWRWITATDLVEQAAADARELRLLRNKLERYHQECDGYLDELGDLRAEVVTLRTAHEEDQYARGQAEHMSAAHRELAAETVVLRQDKSFLFGVASEALQYLQAGPDPADVQRFLTRPDVQLLRDTATAAEVHPQFRLLPLSSSGDNT